MATTKLDMGSDHKEALFNNFFLIARGTLNALEMRYGIQGVVDQVFGETSGEEEMKVNLRQSSAWRELSNLYDYALHGILSDSEDGPSVDVINASDVLKLATSEEWHPAAEWEEIIAMGDGRFALDSGEGMTIYKLSLLANVDQRTVRNAISAGQLTAFKAKTMLEGDQVLIENASARFWLLSRKGFRPTQFGEGQQKENLAAVATPGDFSAFLKHQRSCLGLENLPEKIVAAHPEINAEAIQRLEAGVFLLPLRAVFPLADFYQVGRKELLEAVMRVFFMAELQMLHEQMSPQQASSN